MEGRVMGGYDIRNNKFKQDLLLNRFRSASLLLKPESTAGVMDIEDE
jgi:hypothetical protein